jgi:Ca2+-binding RTX toxin-like protein
MVVFAARNLPVDNSDLHELEGYKPASSSISASLGFVTRYVDGVLSVKVFVDDQMKYKVAKIEVSQNKVNKIFNGEFEAKLFKGDDKIKGSTADDMLYGFKGNDTVTGRGGEDTIYGGKGKDTLYGGTDADTIYGGAGKDSLHGEDGANTLYGGGGKDAFTFDAALMPGNNAHIADYKSGKDVIELDKGAFSGIGGKGNLSKSKFFLADEYNGEKKAVIYDKDSGGLSYSKGGGDIGNAVDFGSVTAGLDLSHKDFLVV